MADIVSNDTTRARAQLEAWRESGADRLDPVRFRFIEAFDRRSAGHVGEARRMLEDRLAALLHAYAADLHRAGAASGDSTPGDADSPSSPCEPARATLAGLVDYLASRARAEDDAHAARPMSRPVYGAEPETLDYFRKTWAKVRTEKQLRQSLDQVPKNAGPLNSSSLVHRSLSRMRELSPGYLQQFLAYVDTLSWLEQLNGGNSPAGKDAPRGGSGTRKSARGKQR